MINDLKKELMELSDKKYQAFSSKLLPNTDNILGVRLPVLRKIAKRISKGNYNLFLNQNDNEFFELTIIEAMLIGMITNGDEAFYLLEKFIPKITNWSICDTLCASAKFLKKDKERTKKLLNKYLNSSDEFECRFCYVVLLMYFIDDDYDFVFTCIKNFNNEKYYAKMAAAWCLSICLIKNFNVCFKDIEENIISPWVRAKGITKAIESYQLSDFQKEKLKEYRKILK